MKPYKFLFLIASLLSVFPTLTKQGQLDSPANISLSTPIIETQDDEDIFSQKNNTRPPRMLPGKEPEAGEIISSTMIEESNAILSNDGKRLFVSVFEGPLRILDVSQAKSLSTLASLELTNSYQRGMAISPDDKRLYIAGTSSFEIIDVSNSSEPKLLGMLSCDRTMTRLSDEKIKPTIAISPDDKTAYVGFLTFEVFDISDPESIKMIYSGEGKEMTTVHLMKDGKTLLVGNSNLWVYDVSKPQSPSQISMYEAKSQISSFAITSDEKTTYVAYVVEVSPDRVVPIDILNTTNIRAIRLIQNGTFTNEKIDRIFLILSRSDSHLYLLGDTIVRVINVDHGFLLKTQAQAITNAVSFCLSPDDTLAYIITKYRLFVLKPLINLQIDTAFTTETWLAGSFPVSGYPHSLAISSDQKTIYLANSQWNKLEKYDISDWTTSKMLFQSSTPSPLSILVSKDGKLVFVFSEIELSIFDASNLNLLAPIKPIKQATKDVKFGLSYDETKVSVSEPIEDPKGRRTLLTIYDLSNPSQPRKVSSSEISVDPDLVQRVSNDCKTAFLLSNLKGMSIVDISNPFSPVIQPSLLQEHDFAHFIFSPTNKSIAFVVSSFQFIHYLTILDLSNLKAPKILSTTILPFSSTKKKDIFLSADSRTFFITQQSGFVSIDVSTPSSPMILTSWVNKGAITFTLSQDGRIVYVGMENRQVMVLDLLPRHTVFFPPTSYGLGGSYSQHVPILHLSPGRKYDSFHKSHKFIWYSRVVNQVTASKTFMEINFSPLPNWMHFDNFAGVLTVEPKSDENIGSYIIRALVSSQIDRKGFREVVPGINTDEESMELAINLIQVGYLDTEGYLTSQFNPYSPLSLAGPYRFHEKKIREILVNNYCPVSFWFRVESSLTLIKKETGFVISTKFPLSVNVLVTISKSEMNEKSDPRFLSLSYSGILATNTNQKTKLTLDGYLENINKALQEITINHPNKDSYCNGTITISDGTNPKIIEEIFNISRYFKTNQAPVENKEKSIQDQVNGANVLLGEYFRIEFSANTFLDPNPEFLKYTLQMPNKNKYLPDWIALKEFTLIGTPPEQITLSKIDLVIVASNEFKSVEIPFTIPIKISFRLILKFVYNWARFIIPAIGLYIILNKIFNLVGAKFYRHPKKFILLTGREIPQNSIYPISFVLEEASISQDLQKEIRKKVALNLGKKKLRDSEFVEYFIYPGDSLFDKDKLDSFIEDAIQSLDIQNNHSLKYFAPRLAVSKKLIYEIIYYDMVNKHLNHPKEKETKQVFDSMKGDWIQFVEVLKNSNYVMKNSQLETKLDSILTTKNLKRIHKKDKLLEREALNIDLLKNALLGYVFHYHNLNYPIHDIDINVMEMVSKRSLMKKIMLFFKLMKTHYIPIPSNEKGTVGYGIRYQIRKNTLTFTGIPEETFAGRKLVVQIMTLKRRIIRELCLMGCEGEGLEMIDSIQEVL